MILILFLLVALWHLPVTYLSRVASTCMYFGRYTLVCSLTRTLCFCLLHACTCRWPKISTGWVNSMDFVFNFSLNIFFVNRVLFATFPSVSFGVFLKFFLRKSTGLIFIYFLSPCFSSNSRSFSFDRRRSIPCPIFGLDAACMRRPAHKIHADDASRGGGISDQGKFFLPWQTRISAQF